MITKFTLYNLFGLLIPALVAIISIPIYLRHFGFDLYGVFLIIITFFGYFALFDFGISRSAGRKIANNHSLGESVNNVITTSLFLGLLASTTGMIFIFFASQFYLSSIDTSQVQINVKLLTYFITLAFPINIIATIFNGVFQGLKWFKSLNIINILVNSFFHIFPLVGVIFFKNSITETLFIMLCIKFLSLPVYFYFLYVDGFLKKARFSKELFIEIGTFGGWAYISILIGTLFLTIDKLFITYTIGASVLVIYAIPFQLSEKLLLISNSFANAVYPYYSENEFDQQLLEKSFLKFVLTISIISILGFILGKIFLKIWLDQSFVPEMVNIFYIFLFSFYIQSLSAIPFAYLTAISKPKLIAKYHIFQFFLYISFLSTSIEFFGLIGAAYLFLIIKALDLYIMIQLAEIFHHLRKKIYFCVICVFLIMILYAL